MNAKISEFLDDASEYLAARKGLLPLIGIGLILVNLALQIVPAGWLSTSNLFLHLGIIVAILGFLLAKAL